MTSESCAFIFGTEEYGHRWFALCFLELDGRRFTGRASMPALNVIGAQSRLQANALAEALAQVEAHRAVTEPYPC